MSTNTAAQEERQATASETLIELDGVRKEYGDVTAVDTIDFAVKQGEFFSLVGPSGCGKTTTLRMISGFEQPTMGSVRLDGTEMRKVPPNERDTNLVFQHLSLFPHMSVGDNVGYGLEKSGIDAKDREPRISEYLELVDLAGYEDRKPGELSGGQQQRVALARALVNEPSVLLLDEPLSSLDRKLRKQMQVELRTLHEKVHGSFFYVTHDQEVAMTLSDRMAVMNEGKLEQIGTPQEIYREPATPFVADFIGDTNLLSGVARNENGTTVVEVGGTDGFSVEVTADVDAGSDVELSIRPEDIDLVDATGTFAGKISERYFQGDQTLYTVALGADLPDVQVVMQGRSSPVEQGEQASFRIEPDAPVLFE